MIVRILGEGQYEVADGDATDRLERLDADLDQALGANNPESFDEALASLIAEVREAGTRVGPDDIRTSDLAVPAEGSSLEEVRELLSGDMSEA